MGERSAMSASVRRPRPHWRFTLAAAATWLALVPLYRSPRLTGALAPFERLTARLTAALVDVCGMEVERSGTVLRHPAGFAYEIYYACTGLFLAAVLVAGLLALPGPRRRKSAAALLGVAGVFALNQARLVSLFYLGVRRPAVFDFAHEVVWEGLMLGAVLWFWSAWWRLDQRRRSAKNSSVRPRASSAAASR